MVRSVLKNMKKEYPHIRYYVVLAYMPGTTNYRYEDFSDTIYTDGLETVPKRFAISKRNDWMLNNSDMVVSYVNKPCGGAYNFTQKAVKKKKRLWNIERP